MYTLPILKVFGFRAKFGSRLAVMKSSLVWIHTSTFRGQAIAVGKLGKSRTCPVPPITIIRTPNNPTCTAPKPPLSESLFRQPPKTPENPQIS